MKAFLLTLFLCLLALPAVAHQVDVNWTMCTSPVCAGYEVDWGPTSGIYTSSAAAGNVLKYTITPINPGPVYIVIRAYDQYGDLGPVSNEASCVVPNTSEVLPPFNNRRIR